MLNFKGIKKKQLNISQTIALAFLFIIILGTILLSLPISAKGNLRISKLTALFTSTSATCVTGLSLVDIWSSFSLFGQIVILLLIEIGGLGFMSIISILFYITNRKNDVHSLSLMADTLGADGIKNIIRVQKRLLIGSFIFEGIGALILFIRFIPTFGVPKALWYGIFHSVSSFCNAGFDLFGCNVPGSSLQTVQNDPVILLTLSILIIVGGLGFVVWDDIATNKRIRNWSVNTKLVIYTSAILLLLGTFIFFLLEYNNDLTMGNMNVGNKLLNSFFQSVSPRTAGFAAVDQATLTGPSKALTIFLMIIGGSAGSTAGGIKTVTFLILIKALITYIRGNRTVTLLYRTISQQQIIYAFTVACSAILLGLFGGFIIEISSQVGSPESYFESVSALATVGLSLGITASLSTLAQIIIITFMYIGRVGLLTITLGFIRTTENPAIKYPPAKIMIG